MNDTRYTAAVIGLGKIGLTYDLPYDDRRIFTHVHALLAHPGFTIVGGVDTSPEAQQLFTTASKAPVFGTIQELFAATGGEIDLVVVAVPTDCHFSVVEEVLRYSVKVILLEKPVARNMPEAVRLADMARRKGVTVAVNYMRRFDPAVIGAKKAISSGHLGTLLSATITYPKGLFENGSHFVDLLLFLFEPPFRVKYAFAYDSHAGDPQVDFVLRRSDFTVTAMAARSTTFSIGEVSILGTAGRIILKESGFEVEYYRVKDSTYFKGQFSLGPAPWDFPPDMGRYQLNVIRSIFDTLSTGESLPSTAESAIETLRLCDDILRFYSDDLGHPKYSKDSVS